jgi:hypothetical protein
MNSTSNCIILNPPLPVSYVYVRLCNVSGPGSVAGYSDWLRAGSSGDRIEVEARFSTPLQALGPTQLPVQLVPGLSRGKEQPGRKADPSPPSSVVVMWSTKNSARYYHKCIHIYRSS